MPGGFPYEPEEPLEDDEPWEPLPPRSMRPLAALAAVVLVSGISGFGTFAYIAGNSEHVTSADGGGAPVVTTTATTLPAETTTSAPAADSEDAETPDSTHEDHESGDTETTTTTAPPDDSGGGSGLSPEDTVIAFFEAMKTGDCDTALNYMTEQSWSRGGTLSREEAVSQCEQSPMAAIEVKGAELANQEGDSATVNVTISQAGQTMTAPMMVTREDGMWKLVNM